MTFRTWTPIRFRYCHHVGEKVALEADLVYPSEWLPEQKPRVLAHRCSHAMLCNLEERPGCIWAGTQPAVDPFTGA